VDGDYGPKARCLVVSVDDLLMAFPSYLIEYGQDRSSIPEVRLSLSSMLPGCLLEGRGHLEAPDATMAP
jgi:hypothetical protein